MMRRVTLERFCEQVKSTKQQDQLKTLFDNQPDGVLILSHPDNKLLKPPKPTPLSIIDPNASVSRLDSSFASFVNPTETDGQEDSDFELVFHNEALLKIVGKPTTKDLHALLSKRIFVSDQQNNRLSLLNAAQGRYSDSILRNTYKYVVHAQADGVSEQDSELTGSCERDRILSFMRNEVIFDGKKSIVLNVRDLTDQ